MPISTAFFYISLEVPSEQDPLIKIRSHLSLKVPGKSAPPPCSPTGPLWRKMPISRAFFNISLYPEKRRASFWTIDPSLSPLSCPKSVFNPSKLLTSVRAFRP